MMPFYCLQRFKYLLVLSVFFNNAIFLVNLIKLQTLTFQFVLREKV